MNFFFNRHKIRALIIGLFSVFFLSLPAYLSHGAVDVAPEVTEIKHWTNPAYTRIVISLTKKTSFTHKLLEKDPAINMPWKRLYIDIEGATLPNSLKKPIPINDGLLKMARAAQHNAGTVRVVLDVESISDYKVFPLEDPYRIIIDVMGEKKDGHGADGIIKKDLPFIKDAKGETPGGKMAPTASKIVIDPGHGGKDPGAIGRSGLKEKDVTLKIARLLRQRLAKESGARIIMTRSEDVFIPLEERTAIANSQDADLFISIHVNASPKRSASGIETYVLDISKDAEARRLAARENSTSAKAVSDLEFILNDLMRTTKTNDSRRLAAAVHDNLVAGVSKKYDNVKSNGVKGAPFYVLVGTKMPCILIEVSYISNANEEKRLKNELYLKEIVEGITTGVARYMNGAGPV
ncbi:MAG: N-acetylmuramoyl-L-alanine amidase [Deltaproteobacteria bacterium]